MTFTQKLKLKGLIRKLIAAEIDAAWEGAGDPAHIPEIQKALKLAKERLNTFIDFLVDKG